MAAKSESPLVSIVILNWNGLEDTKLCLDYAQKLDYPNYEIVVVDNGSSADQKEYLSKLKNITYVDNPKNRGFAGGQTDGFNHAKGDYILLLNNDAVIQQDYLKEAMPFFEDPSVAVVGGRSYFWNEEEALLDKSNRFYSYMTIDPISAETTLNMHDYGVTQEVNVVSGSAVIVSRKAIDKVGYLWEEFFAYYEETDLFARMKRAGYKVLYSPKLQIWHKNGASSGAQSGSFFFFYHIFRNRYMFALRNFDNEYLKLFKKSYYNLALKSVTEIAASKSQRTLASAYLKAINYVQTNNATLNKSRTDLKNQLTDSSYSRQIIKEQVTLSVVVDATELSKKEVLRLVSDNTANNNPLQEYVIVTKHSDVSSKAMNVRVVVDRGYFKTPSINLGCLAARFDWILVCSADKVPNIDTCLEKIVDTYLTNPSVIPLTKSSAVIRKTFFELVGGLQAGTHGVAENIIQIIELAYINQTLSSNEQIYLSSSQEQALQRRLDLGRSILALNEASRWQKILAKYYRLYQLNNLIQWTLEPKISLRVKAGRTRNIIFSSLKLNKTALATELRHIRNEIVLATQQSTNLDNVTNFPESVGKIVKNTKDKLKDIPVFIICFERVDDLKKQIAWLESIGLKKIVLIDNDSTYPPLLSFYESTEYQVLKLGRNIGHVAPWSLGIIRSLVPNEMYIVTDPDVIPDIDCPKDVIEHFFKLHQKYPSHKKVGFSLKIDDLPDTYPLKKEVISWEEQFWKNELESNVYEAGVDTTFALYKPFTFTYTLHPSIRTGAPYTARHTPWYANPNKKSDEENYYRMRASSNVTSWNVDELPERYKKEMSDAK